jgi:uncharacterized repeat protein (TIGR03803 family)
VGQPQLLVINEKNSRVGQPPPNSKGGWNETVLHRFVDNPGSNPASGLISDAAGNLYGTTLGDGEMTAGSVFQVAP